MRRVTNSVSALMLLLIGMLTFSAKPVQAADYRTTETISIKQEFTVQKGSAPSDTFRYRLTALENGNPMPEGSSSGSYDFTISASDTAEIGPMEYLAPGIYTYKLEPVVETKQKGYEYAANTYEVSVYVTNTETGGLQAVMVVKTTDGTKTSEIKFDHKYSLASETPPTVTQQTTTKVTVPVSSLSKPGKATTSPVKTGDDTSVWLWVTLGAAAILCVIILGAAKKKKTK